jgi:hypothetical protein
MKRLAVFSFASLNCSTEYTWTRKLLGMPKTQPKKKSPQTRSKRLPRKGIVSPSAAPRLRGKDLESAIVQFQSEPDEKKAHQRWKKIESSVFGVQFED